MPPESEPGPEASRFNELLRSLASITWNGSSEYLKKSCERLREITSAWRVTVLSREGSEQFSLAALAGAELSGDGGSGGGGLVSTTVANSGEPFICDDISSHPELTGPYTGEYENRSCAVLPLGGERVEGLLCFSSLPSLEPWFDRNNTLDDWQPVLDLLAGHVRSTGSSEVRRAEADAGLRELIAEASRSDSVPGFFSELALEANRTAGTGALMLGYREQGSSRLLLATPEQVHPEVLEAMFSELSETWEERLGVFDFHGPAEATVVGEKRSSEAAAAVPSDAGSVMLGSAKRALGVLAWHGGLDRDSPYCHLLSLVLRGASRAATVRGRSAEPGSIISPGSFHVALEREFHRAERHQIDLSVVIFDLDEFRRVSEQHGVEAAEEVLDEVGAMISENLRAGDMLSRYAGENFAAVMPLTRATDSERVARRIQNNISHHSFSAESSDDLIQVSVSAGVASYRKNQPGTESELLEFASRAVRKAKMNDPESTMVYDGG